MCAVLVPHDQQRYALTLALGMVILALAFAGHPNVNEAHHYSPQQACHHHACWMLTPELILPSALVLTWFASVFRCILLQEHVLPIFKPPRLRILFIHL